MHFVSDLSAGNRKVAEFIIALTSDSKVPSAYASVKKLELVLGNALN